MPLEKLHSLHSHVFIDPHWYCIYWFVKRHGDYFNPRLWRKLDSRLSTHVRHKQHYMPFTLSSVHNATETVCSDGDAFVPLRQSVSLPACPWSCVSFLQWSNSLRAVHQVRRSVISLSPSAVACVQVTLYLLPHFHGLSPVICLSCPRCNGCDSESWVTDSTCNQNNVAFLLEMTVKIIRINITYTTKHVFHAIHVAIQYKSVYRFAH